MFDYEKILTNDFKKSGRDIDIIYRIYYTF